LKKKANTLVKSLREKKAKRKSFSREPVGLFFLTIEKVRIYVFKLVGKL